MQEKDTVQLLMDMQETLEAQFRKANTIDAELKSMSRRLNDIGNELKAHMAEKEHQDTELFISRLGALTDKQERTLLSFPKSLELEIRHRFQAHLKVSLIVISISIIVSTLCIGLWAAASRDNKRLEANDIKYRYIKVASPDFALSIDTTYSNDVQQFRASTEQLEARKRAIEEAEVIVREREKEAGKARQEVEKLRNKK